MPIRPKTILIVNIRLIGDVILTTPLIGLFREAYPDAAIDMLVNRGTGEFLEKDPRVRKVFYSDNGETSKEKGKKPYLLEIFRRYDIAVNFNASDRGNLAVLFAGKSVRAGLYTGVRFWQDLWKRVLFTHPIKYPFPIHIARLCEVVAIKLGLQVTRLESRVFWDQEDKDKVEETLRRRNIAGSFFVVHPFARWRYKHWRFEHFATVSDAIAERYRMCPVWTSSPSAEEKSTLAKAAALCRISPVQIPGEFNLNQMTCLLSKASFYLGLDTAVSHLAATTGIPMVALYGPTIADWWSPWNNNGPVAQQCPLPRGTQRTGNIIVIQKDKPCVACGRSGCNDNGLEPPCMLEIEIEEVLKASATLLDLKGGAV